MRTNWLKAAFTALAFCGTATAEEAGITAFSGQWVGKVTVETSGPTDFPTSVRESGVTITPNEDGGFKLEWSTVKREKGDPNRPDEAVSDVELIFRYSGEDRWQVPGVLTAGQAVWIARLNETTLTVSGFAITEDGQAELQTYVRTIEDGTMGLVYTRVIDGVTIRRASGTLTRFAQ